MKRSTFYTRLARSLRVGQSISGLKESQGAVVRRIVGRRGGKVRAVRQLDFTYTVLRIA